MNLEALLNELRGNVLRDDSGLASGPSDYLWDDETLVRYINDAYLRFARRTLSLRDASTPTVCEVPLDAGVFTYPLHASVLSVVSARYDTDEADLARVGRSLLMDTSRGDLPWFDPESMSTLQPGRPRAFSTDETVEHGIVTLRVWPTPTADEAGKVLKLRVARKPLELLSLDETEAECELPEEYQIDMLSWAAYRALSTSDVDGHSAAADKHKLRFEEAMQEVLKDMRRKMFAPTGWQFGQGGFAWGTV